MTTRRIIVPQKSVDEVLKKDLAPSPKPEPDNSDISTLLSKTIEILRREVTHLLMESSSGKLGKGSSTDLVNYIKLLNELHANEKDILDQLSDEELQAIVESRNGNKT
jgi:hypothetical protein